MPTTTTSLRKKSPTKRPTSGRAAKPKTIDAYLAAVPDDKRRALQKLRAQIRAAAPAATEGISYGLPTFRLDGGYLLSIGAAAAHCSIYGVSDKAATGARLPELEDFESSGRGTIRFRPDKPLPVALVNKLVKARVARTKPRAG